MADTTQSQNSAVYLSLGTKLLHLLTSLYKTIWRAKTSETL